MSRIYLLIVPWVTVFVQSDEHRGEKPTTCDQAKCSDGCVMGYPPSYSGFGMSNNWYSVGMLRIRIKSKLKDVKN